MTGPIDKVDWPQRMPARVIDAHARTIHGYSVPEDLAVHYSFAENVLVALRGEAPTEAEGRAFEMALSFSALVSAGDAQAHAAAVGRLCMAESKNVAAIAAVVGAERASRVVSEWEAFVAWLDERSGPVPPAALAPECAVARQFLSLLPKDFAAEEPFTSPLALAPAIIAVFHGCGLTSRERMVAALTVASLGASIAEALSMRPLAFRDYPMVIPPFEYVEESSK